MKLIIAKINEKIFEGEFESVVLPGGRGELEIFPDHAPLLSSLQKGKIIYQEKDGEKKEIEIEKGFVEVNKNEVIVVL
jgi:F-type H+-transporting ATPase subunit epsilon